MIYSLKKFAFYFAAISIFTTSCNAMEKTCQETQTLSNAEIYDITVAKVAAQLHKNHCICRTIGDIKNFVWKTVAEFRTSLKLLDFQISSNLDRNFANGFEQFIETKLRDELVSEKFYWNVFIYEDARSAAKSHQPLVPKNKSELVRITADCITNILNSRDAHEYFNTFFPNSFPTTKNRVTFDLDLETLSSYSPFSENQASEGRLTETPAEERTTPLISANTPASGSFRQPNN